ncbi:PepSY-associated TM helix domain-containing protein [Parvularcula marina]|uniref:PepSY domain-containing protein n=1 Tax=Parvularcula marina TaxID=2292771 RepID=A0A371R7I1_9PROT|nr:PepSY-associated TM helix domain-containing protein [Parvularcula marina]RFB01405.1 PepSY domain-containing protein [Parvularcula marina]
MALWPKIPSGFVRSVLAGHSSLGLFFAGLLYLICLSGTIMVFHEEMAAWEQPGMPAGEPSDSAAMAMLENALVAGAEKTGSELHSVSLFTQWREDGHTSAHYYADNGEYGSWIADPVTGELVADNHAPLTDFIEQLHIYLRLTDYYGIYLVGLIGVAMLSLVISGVLAHPRIFRDAFNFRRGGALRLQEADVHNRLSVWALPFHLMVSFTGAFLGLSFLIVAMLAFVAYDGDQAAAVRAVLGPQPTEDHSPAPIPPMMDILDDARERTGLDRLNYIQLEHPETMGQIVTIEMAAPDELSSGEVVYYDAEGNFIETSGSAFGSIGPQVLAAMGPLHFGAFGGMWVKVLYIVFGLASTGVTVTGISIWLARRREQGRPAPQWERIWIATVWGGAIAAVAPGLVLSRNESLGDPVFLASLAIALILSWIIRRPLLLSGTLKAILAAVLVALAVMNVMAHGELALGGASLGVNLTLLAVALGLVASLFMRKPAHEI